jgi:hypothetical protein
MIRPLGDAHTSIRARDLKTSFWGNRKDVDRFVGDGVNHYFNVVVPELTRVTDRYLRPPIRKWCNDQVQFAWLADSVGYLRLLSFAGYTNDNAVANGLRALEAALDTIFGGPARMQALVIDVRVNSGGSDAYALAVLSRLATGEYVGYRKQARADPVDRSKWTPLQRRIIHPSTRPGFQGTVRLALHPPQRSLSYP